jgi:hypothetical protein
MHGAKVKKKKKIKYTLKKQEGVDRIGLAQDRDKR